MLTQPAHRAGGHAQELVGRLLDQAARDGAAMALLFSDMSHEHQPTGFDLVAMTEAELSVAESTRRGAPMTPIRGGEERDLAAIVAMGQVRARSFRFHLDRDVDFVQYAITKKRLLAGLAPATTRQTARSPRLDRGRFRTCTYRRRPLSQQTKLGADRYCEACPWVHGVPGDAGFHNGLPAHGEVAPRGGPAHPEPVNDSRNLRLTAT